MFSKPETRKLPGGLHTGLPSKGEHPAHEGEITGQTLVQQEPEALHRIPGVGEGHLGDADPVVAGVLQIAIRAGLAGSLHGHPVPAVLPVVQHPAAGGVEGIDVPCPGEVDLMVGPPVVLPDRLDDPAKVVPPVMGDKTGIVHGIEGGGARRGEPQGRDADGVHEVDVQIVGPGIVGQLRKGGEGPAPGTRVGNDIPDLTEHRLAPLPVDLVEDHDVRLPDELVLLELDLDRTELPGLHIDGGIGCVPVHV